MAHENVRRGEGAGGGMTLMDRLKTETQDLHTAAERHPFQQALVRGTVNRGQYAAWLSQMLHVHRAVERALEAARPSHAVFALVTEQQRQTGNLEADLRALGVDMESVEVFDATRRAAESIEASSGRQPLAALGYHYVLEGSKNGNRFIAKALRPALGLRDGQGDRYLDPHGDAQRGMWAAFRGAVGEHRFSKAEEEVVIEAAREMFAHIWDISRDLAAAVMPEASVVTTGAGSRRTEV